MLTLVASALAGGDCIDAADALRAGGTVGVLGCVVKAPPPWGPSCAFRWGHSTRPREPPVVGAGLWGRTRRLAPDHRPGLDHLYGLYTGARGYHPLLAIAAGTGEVLMSRLREGRANTARGAAHFLRETVGRVASPGDNSRCGPTAASTPTLSLPPAGKWMSASLSPSASAPACRGDTRGGLDSHSLLDGRRRRCRRDDLHPVPDQAGRRAGAAHCPAGEADGRFPTLRQIQLSRLLTDRDGETLGTGGRSSPPRRGRERHTRPQVRRRAEPHAVGALRRQLWLGPGDGA